MRVCGHTLTIEEGGRIVEERYTQDPLHEIEILQQQFRMPDIAGMPRFTGGLVGYFGYDCIGYIEPRLQNKDKDDPLNCPDILLMVSEQVVVFDNLSGKLYIIVHANPETKGAYEEAITLLDALTQKLLNIPAHAADDFIPRAVHEQDFVSGFTREGFEAAVKRVKEYIVEGDAMQVVLSQRLSIPFQWRRLKRNR